MKTQKKHAERTPTHGEQPIETEFANIISVTGSAKPEQMQQNAEQEKEPSK